VKSHLQEGVIPGEREDRKAFIFFEHSVQTVCHIFSSTLKNIGNVVMGHHYDNKIKNARKNTPKFISESLINCLVAIYWEKRRTE
jgi:hypothetical protein